MKFDWTGKLHFLGDVLNQEAWFVGKKGVQRKPTLDFGHCSERELRELCKLDGKRVKLTLEEIE